MARGKMENDENDKLMLDLDEFWEEGYFYTEYDIGGAGHSITIRAEDKEAFISAFKDEIGKRLENLLEPVDEDEE